MVQILFDGGPANGRVVELSEMPQQVGALAAISKDLRVVPEHERDEFVFTFTWSRKKQAYVNETEHQVW